MANLTASLRVVWICGLLTSPSLRAATYPLPGPDDDLIGEPSWTLAAGGENLANIAYDHGLGFREVLHSNPGLDPWHLQAGQRVVLPTAMLLPHAPREGLVINLPELRLYYFAPKSPDVLVYPIAVGRVDWRTPLGTTWVSAKVRNPVWFVPESIRAEHAAQGELLPDVVEPGPDNPLGTLALRLGWPQVLIHGTNKPMGIGMPVTHGCVRLYPQDMEQLFGQVSPGARVTVVDQPYKLGRHQGRWYLEAHPLLTDDPAQRQLLEPAPTLLKLKVRAAARRDAGALDATLVAAVLQRSDGMPTLVETPASAVSTTLRTPPAASVVRYLPPAPALSTSRVHLALAEPPPLLLKLLALSLLVSLGLAGLSGRRRRLHRRDIRA